MNNQQNPNLFILGGLSGIIGTICYIVAITISMSPQITFLVAMAWPILSIVCGYSIYRYIALQKQSASNQLAFVLGCLALAMVAMMICIQLAVKTGIGEHMARTLNDEQEVLKLIKYSLRWIDLGVDVAWDLFIGAALIFLAIALKGHTHFGLWWSIPAATLGVIVIAINAVTFPMPPNTQGMFDVGPFIGTYMIILDVRLIYLGLRMKKSFV
ncbi:MAG: hypothetical protein ACE5GI_09755 [Candidatus Aminicenantales bacterium]